MDLFSLLYYDMVDKGKAYDEVENNQLLMRTIIFVTGFMKIAPNGTMIKIQFVAGY